MLLPPPQQPSCRRHHRRRAAVTATAIALLLPPSCCCQAAAAAAVATMLSQQRSAAAAAAAAAATTADKESENASAHRLASSMNKNCPVRISQQHQFCFISLFIYLYDIGEIAGGCTRRKPPDNIVIDSISPAIYLSIYLSSIHLILGKSWEDIPGGNLLQYCHQ